MQNVIQIGPKLSSQQDRDRQRQQMLAQVLSGNNYGGPMGGVRSAGESIAKALMYKDQEAKWEKDDEERRNTLSKMLSGATAKPWVNPDTGEVSEAPAGGVDGMLAALSDSPNSMLAETLAPELIMAKMNREQSLSDAEEKRKRDQEIWEARFNAQQGAAEDQIRLKASLEGEDAPGFGNSLDGNMWDAYNNGPADPRYQSAVAYLSQPKTIQTPTGMMTIPAAIRQDGSLINQGGPSGGVMPVSDGPQIIPGTERPEKPVYSKDQAAAAGFANRMRLGTEEMNRVLSGPDGKPGTDDDFNPADTWEHAKAGVPIVGNHLASPEYQQLRQAQENWVTANLRLESGAVIGAEEMEQEIRKYFPLPGDAPQVVAQKSRARAAAEENLMKQSQGAFDQMFGQQDQPQPPRTMAISGGPAGNVDLYEKYNLDRAQ